ncbi:MAG: HepT-like ribonuclease domain-containing protein [Thermoleophilia bacterium]
MRRDRDRGPRGGCGCVPDQSPQAQQIVDFRNQLTHGYMTVNDTIVWGVAVRDAPLLRRACADLLSELDDSFAD